MCKKCLLLVLLLAVVACSQDQPNQVVPTRAQSAGFTPRELSATVAPNLPPTWTPEPIVEGQHLGETGGEAAGEEESGDQVTYVVQAGDTLGEIAAQFGVTLAALADRNNIRNWDVIEVGTVLIIP